MDNIQVAIRVRPLIAKEANTGQNKVWNVKDNTLEPLDQNGKPGIPYTFDRIFDEHMTTYDVFQGVAKPIIDAAVQGFHGTIFAYGQSSSGKTFTMSGSAMNPGIIKLAVNEIFTRIDKIPDREYLVRCCYMEIYNEKVSDLLSTEDKIIKIQEDTERNVNVIGVEERYVMNEDDLNAVLKEGEARRHMAETKQNDRSSRSHCILRIIIESRQVDDESAVMVAHLNFVDLAGSEKAGENTGDRFREGCSINKSLFTLARIIAKLSEGVSNQHIGYRDSKLTRILQNALGGNSKTAVIATITPASLEESHSTLKFATRAKSISNKPIVNEVLSDAALLKRSHKEIQKLQEKIKAMENIDVSELQGEKEDLEKKLKEKEEMEQKYHDLLNSLKYVIQSGTTQQKELIPQSKRRKTWCPGKGASVSSPRRFSFINRMNFFNEADETGIEDISPPHIRKRKSDGKLQEPAEKKHVTFQSDEDKEDDDEAFIVDPLARELLDMQDKYEDLLKDYEELKKEKMEIEEYHRLELHSNKEGMDRMIQLEETERRTNEDMKNVRKELTELEEKFIEKTQKMKSMEEKMISLSDENFHLEHRLQIQNKKVKECQSELDNIRKPAEEGIEERSEVERLRSTNEQLGSEVEKLQSSNEDLRSEVEKLKSANEEQLLEVEKLKTSNDELKEHQRTVEVLNNKVQELEKTIKIFEETVEDFQSENKQLQNSVEEKTQKLEELKTRTESHEDNSNVIKELQQKVVSLEEEVKQHSGEEDKTEEVEEVRRKLEEANGKIIDLEEQLEQMKGSSSEAEENMSEHRIHELEKTIKVFEETVEEFQAENKQLQNALEKKIQEVEELKITAESSEFNNMIQELHQRVLSLEEEIKQHVSEKEDLQAKNKNLENSLVDTRKSLESSEDTKTVEEKVEYGRRMLEEANRKIVELEEKVEAQVEEMDKLSSMAEEKRNDLESQLKDRENELNRLKENFHDSERSQAVRIQELETNLQQETLRHAEELKNVRKELMGSVEKETHIEKGDCVRCRGSRGDEEFSNLQKIEDVERLDKSVNVSLQEESQETKSENAMDEEERARLEKNIVELQDKIDTLEQERGNLKDPTELMEQFQNIVEVMKKEHAKEKHKMQEEFESQQDKIIQEELERLRSQCEELAHTVNEKEALCEEFRKAVTEKEALCVELHEKIMQSENLPENNVHRPCSSCQKYEEDICDFQRQLAHKTEKVERLEECMCKLKEENENLQRQNSDISNLLEEINSLQTQRNENESKIISLQEENERLQENVKLNRSTRHRSESSSRMNRTHSESMDYTEMCERLSMENVSLQERVEELNEEVSSLQDQMKHYQQEVECLEDNLREAQEESRVSREKVWELEGKLISETSQQISEPKDSQETQTEDFTAEKSTYTEQASQTEEQEDVFQLQRNESEESCTKEQLQLLSVENEHLKERLSSLEEEAREHEEWKRVREEKEEVESHRAEALNQELISMKEVHQDLNERLQDVTKNWEEAEEKVLELSHCLEETKEHVTSLTKKQEELEEEIVNYQRQIEALHGKVSDLTDQKENEEVNNYCQKLEAEIQTVKEENEKLQSALEQKEKKVIHFEQQICLLEETQKEFQSELKKLEDEKTSLESKLSSVNNLKSSHTEEVQNLKEEMETLSSENEKLKAKLEKGKAEYAKQQEVLQTRWERVMELSDETNRLRDSMEELEQSLASANTEIHNLKLKNMQLESTLRDKKREVADVQEQCQFLESEVESQKSEIQSMSEEMWELKQNLDQSASSSALEEMQTKMVEKDSIINSLEKELQSMEHELKAGEEKVEKVTKELQKKITAKEEEVMSLKSDLEGLQCKLKASEDIHKEVSDQSIVNPVKEELQAEIERKDSELGSLRSQLQTLQAQLEKEGVQELRYTISELEVNVQNYKRKNSELEQVIKKMQSGASIPQILQKEIEQIKSECETLKNEREKFRLEEKMKRAKLVSEFNSQRLTIQKQKKSIQDLLKELEEVDSKVVGKEIMEKLSKEEKENDKLWADLQVKDREIQHLRVYQKQVVDLNKQVAELEKNKLDLEKKLKESRKMSERHEEDMFTPQARELADKKRENFALRMELEKAKDSTKEREQELSEVVDRYEKRISTLKNEIRRLQQDNETTVLIPPTKKTLFQDPVGRPSDNSSQCSNTSSNDSSIAYKASCSGAVDQYSNLLLKNENKRLEKENKKLTNKVTQMEAELRHYKENRQQKREENGKLSSVVKKEPLEDTKGIELDFSIPKVSTSVTQQTSFRGPKSSKKDLPTDNINSEDQCATQ